MTETCKRGHERTPENTYYQADGNRRCRECKRVRDQRYDSRATNARYNQTSAGRWRRRRYRLALAKTATLQRMEQLAAEEAELAGHRRHV